MDFTEEQQALIEQNGGVIPPDLALQLLDAANGDTVARSTEDGGQPQVDESQLSADNAVILAKDGKHTIPYDKLVEARTASQDWQQKYVDAQQQLAELQAQAQVRQDAGQAATVQDVNVQIARQAIESGVDPDLFGDFGAEDMANGIRQLMDAELDKRLQAALAPILAQLSPVQQQQQQSAEQAHFDAIRAVHPDAESIVESQEFAQWLQQQPSITQGAYATVLYQGSATEINELLGLYKSSASPSTQTDVVRAAAQRAIGQAQYQPPVSLSDLPSGSPVGVSREERLAAMSPVQLSEEMQNWTSEQIQDFLDRRV